MAAAREETVLIPFPSPAAHLHYIRRTGLSPFLGLLSLQRPVQTPECFKLPALFSTDGTQSWRLTSRWFCSERSPEENILGTTRHQFESHTSKMSSCSKAHLKEMEQYHNCVINIHLTVQTHFV